MAVPRPGFEAVGVDPIQLGRYILLDPIAEGRTGTVHRACLRRDGRDDEILAIKRISEEHNRDQNFAERFVELTRRAAQLEHPAHCAIEDVDWDEDGSLHVAMEWIEGKDLGRVAEALHERGQIMPAQLVTYIGAQIASALTAAHAMTRASQPAPLFQGELAPADILIGYDGRVKLTGLGCTELPNVAHRAGYRAPELARGASCSARGDVFSLAACLYELLAGRPVADAGRSGVRRPESYITQIIPRPLERILNRALADQPDARFDSPAALGQALQRWSAAQPNRCDGRALAMFMIELFDTAIAEGETRLRAWLARVAVGRSSTPAAASSSAPARQGYTQLVRASVHAGPSLPRTDDFDDAAEHTPAHGVLMRQLAAEMVDPEEAVRESGERERAVEPVEPDEPIDLGDLGELDAAPQLEHSHARRRGSDLPFPDLGDEAWDEPAAVLGGWISESEERESSAPAPPRPSTPAREKPQAHAPRPAAPRRPSMPVAQPRPSAPPLPLPAPAPFARPARRSWLVPALIASGLAVLGGAFALFQSGSSEQSTLDVRTRPAGAEVFLRGARLGRAPLRLDDLQSGTATLELHRPGFEVVSREIRLEPGKAVLLDVDLIPAPAPAAVPRTPAAQAADLQAQLAAAQGAAHAAQEAATDERERAGAERRSRRAEDETQAQAAETFAPSAQIAPAEDPAPVVSVVQTEPAELQTAPAAPKRPVVAAQAPARAASSPRGITRAATVIEQNTPRFPARARRMGIAAGVVTIEYTVDRNGAVKDASVVKADPPKLFDEVALRALQSWRYQPKLDNGTPVESRQRFTFRFTDE